MITAIEHSEGTVTVRELSDGSRAITVTTIDEGYMPFSTCRTRYDLELIRQIIAVKGIRWVCDEIMRDESPNYVQRYLQYSLMSYLSQAEFENKRILDVGCGCGASTLILGRMFPSADIVGVELEQEFLNIAEMRAVFYGLGNLRFFLSPSGEELPASIGTFDHIILSAVYEHLLPTERKLLAPKLWGLLRPGGTLFINQTPDRRFPIETHTTMLPFINYLPKSIALLAARHLSIRKFKNETWDVLLRGGIRGTTPREIMDIFRSCCRLPEKPGLLVPELLGIRKQSDIWYRASRNRLDQRWSGFRRRVLNLIINLILLTQIPIGPYLSLAIRKPTG
jgi:2-polyprenyl-3-methyl-5-hydroxy-6-metoxy-1,4-benzoquinol methylase